MTSSKLLSIVSLSLAIAASVGAVATGQQIDVVNNQPFAVHMPIIVRGVTPGDGATAMQKLGGDTVVVVDAKASSTTIVPIAIPSNVRLRNRVTLAAKENAVAVTFDGKDAGTLAWGVIVRPVDKKAPKTKEGAIDTKGDFAAEFKPLPLSFAKTAEGPVFETWSASGEASGLKLDVEVRGYRAGFLDVTARYTNESAPTSDVYAAIVCRWEQPMGANRTLCYDSKTSAFNDGAFSGFREGEGRHLYVMRGVDWVNTALSGGASALWINDFTANFTTHREKTDSKTGPVGPRWLGANTAQVAQEAQAKGDAVYSISEIARPNIKGYLSRLSENVLPPKGEGLSIASRVVFSDEAVNDQRADENFIAYVGFNPQEKTADGAKVSIGVPYTRFGTNYFAYSTLGENFNIAKQAGMSREGYWPLAPETVKQHKLFADDIKRDLRIAKAMGFELIRLHHLEMLWDKDAAGKELLTQAQRDEYLDFYFAELKNLGFKALVDVKLTPEQTATLVKRYRELIEGVEIDNEALIFQIFDEDVQYWKDVYKAVKDVAPDMPVHWTTHTNTGAFERMRTLGIPFDRVGAHAYMDSVEAIPSGKDYALAIANYASKANKPPLITEWNWRFLTRMTPDARAKVYPPIFENVLKMHCMPIIYQFQFNDSLAMNPTGLKGIRHYELLNLSRRPKPEAFELMKLIRQYANPALPQRAIETEYEVIDMHPGMKGNARHAVHMTNRTDHVIKVKVTPEGPAGIDVAMHGQTEFDLQPGQRMTGELVAKIPDDAAPGFYNVFARIDAGKEGVTYSWAEIRKPGAPKIDPKTNPAVAYSDDALKFDFNRPIAVVYPTEASVMELEAAWVIYQTLESATGRVVDMYQSNDLPDDVKKRGGIIWVGHGRAEKPSVTRMSGSANYGEQLLVGGKDEQQVTLAAMDLTLRYWPTAKDSAASKVGLVAEKAGKAGGKTDLD